MDINNLLQENKKLRQACRLIHQRARVKSGSKEMADIDEFCKSLNLNVWQWPLGNFWDFDAKINSNEAIEFVVQYLYSEHGICDPNDKAAPYTPEELKKMAIKILSTRDQDSIWI